MVRSKHRGVVRCRSVVRLVLLLEEKNPKNRCFLLFVLFFFSKKRTPRTAVFCCSGQTCRSVVSFAEEPLYCSRTAVLLFADRNKKNHKNRFSSRFWWFLFNKKNHCFLFSETNRVLFSKQHNNTSSVLFCSLLFSSVLFYSLLFSSVLCCSLNSSAEEWFFLLNKNHQKNRSSSAFETHRLAQVRFQKRKNNRIVF